MELKHIYLYFKISKSHLQDSAYMKNKKSHIKDQKFKIEIALDDCLFSFFKSK